MIEKYFKNGVRFRWTAPGAVPNLGNQDGTIVDSTTPTAPLVYIGLGASVDPILMQVHVSTFGFTMNGPIQHQWLDYSWGRTARIPLAAYDVLTGKMSGCYVARWTDRGVTYAGHVGTIQDDAVNRRVKRTFAFAMPKNTTAFNPGDAWSFNELITANNAHGGGRFGSTAVFALVTTAGQFFSIGMVPTGVNEWTCAGIKPCAPIPHDTLKLTLLRD